MLFSIIIPVFNKEEGIKTSIASVLNQDFSDYEVIVVNDGSTDSSMTIVESLADSRFRIISQKNSGPSAARNRGIVEASGEYTIFLDADDELLPGALGNIIKNIQKYQSHNVFCFNHLIEQDAKIFKRAKYYPTGIIWNNYRSWFFNLLIPCQGCVIFRTGVLKKYRYPENLRRWEDASFMFDVMRENKVIRFSEPSFVYHRSLSEGMFARKSIAEDFCGHLEPKGKPFWEKVCLYKLYKEAQRLYPNEVNFVYPKPIFSHAVKYTYAISMAVIDILSNMISKIKS